jgi:hypothetical protein
LLGWQQASSEKRLPENQFFRWVSVIYLASLLILAVFNGNIGVQAGIAAALVLPGAGLLFWGILGIAQRTSIPERRLKERFGAMLFPLLGIAISTFVWVTQPDSACA